MSVLRTSMDYGLRTYVNGASMCKVDANVYAWCVEFGMTLQTQHLMKVCPQILHSISIESYKFYTYKRMKLYYAGKAPHQLQLDGNQHDEPPPHPAELVVDDPETRRFQRQIPSPRDEENLSDKPQHRPAPFTRTYG